ADRSTPDQSTATVLVSIKGKGHRATRPRRAIDRLGELDVPQTFFKVRRGRLALADRVDEVRLGAPLAYKLGRDLDRPQTALAGLATENSVGVDLVNQRPLAPVQLDAVLATEM